MHDGFGILFIKESHIIKCDYIIINDNRQGLNALGFWFVGNPGSTFVP
jgi:hypothetical protein